ncbi:aldehyde dehydrogenase family protein [Nocardia sp. NPDC004711]
MTTDAPTPYGSFDTMPIGGKWRRGASDTVLADTDPWSGEVLAELPVATTEDLLLGGEPGGPAGLSMPPHVLLGTNDVATAREEVFGPTITIIKARDESDALRIANDTEYGLSSAVFTADVERGARFALQLEVGMTHINDSPVNAEPNTAYGGEKQSGLGRFGGRWAINEFTTDHWVSLQHRRRGYSF